MRIRVLGGGGGGTKFDHDAERFVALHVCGGKYTDSVPALQSREIPVQEEAVHLFERKRVCWGREPQMKWHGEESDDLQCDSSRASIFSSLRPMPGNASTNEPRSAPQYESALRKCDQ